MIGVIADDITGAAELGAIATRYGLSAELFLEGPLRSDADLVCFDTDSRSCAPGEAALRAARAAGQLSAAGAQWIYKKVDSVLRGNVLAEVESIRDRLGARRALLAPANPSLGRTIRNGHYFIADTPLEKTDFRFDPEYPRKTSEVAGLLAPGGSDEIQTRRPGEALTPEGIIVAEVGSGDDLRLWASCLDASTLPAGGAEFFGALLAARGHRLIERAAGQEPFQGRELFVCGSTSESTRQFVGACRAAGMPVFGLPPELACAEKPSLDEHQALAGRVAAEWDSHQRVVLALELPPMGRVFGPRMATRLAEIALKTLSRAANARVFVEGGATAACVVRCAGWQRLRVTREYAQGVVETLTPGEPGRRFTMKPGSYAWPEVIMKLS